VNNTFMPRGFEPFDSPSGDVKRRRYETDYDDGPIVGQFAPVVGSLFVGDPVMMDHRDRRIKKAMMGTGYAIKGILMGLFDAEGRPRRFRPEGRHTKPWTAIVCDDPDQEWVLMESGNVVRRENFWSNADLMDTGGSIHTGQSGVVIDSRTISGGGIGQYEGDQVTVIDVLATPQNEIDQPFTRLIVKVNNYQNVGDRHRPLSCDGDPGEVEGVECP
jgi:hypothetical protein